MRPQQGGRERGETGVRVLLGLLGGVNLGLAALLEGHAAFLFDNFVELLSHRF